MITLKQYFMGRDESYSNQLTPELNDNAIEVVNKANDLLSHLGYSRGVRSGWRPKEINAMIPGASKTSKHMTCQAVDIEDNDGKLKSWCIQNLSVLEDLGLWMESPEFTPSWLHLQTVAPNSGHRVFIP